MGARIVSVPLFFFHEKTCLAHIVERDYIIVHTLESNIPVHGADNRGARAVQCKSVLRMHCGRNISCCKAGRVHGCIKRIHNIILCIISGVYYFVLFAVALSGPLLSGDDSIYTYAYTCKPIVRRV